jgi:Uma2 family endonuclease
MKPASSHPPQPLLHDGQRLTQKEFHRRYEAYPENVKAELIGGVVYMASPLKQPHAQSHIDLGTVLNVFKAATPGLMAVDNATTTLGGISEPQPDVSLRILPEYGGRAIVNKDRILEGPPELIAEVADSSKAIDPGPRRIDYQREGVLEYLVVCLREQELRWFDFRAGEELRPTRQGVHRSRIFPGLWIAGPALLKGDTARLLEVVQQGIASKAHSAFVNRLARANRRPTGEAGAE